MDRKITTGLPCKATRVKQPGGPQALFAVQQLGQTKRNHMLSALIQACQVEQRQETGSEACLINLLS